MATVALLLAETAEGGGGGSGFTSLIVFAVFGVALYFLMIRPQQKRQKEQQQLLENLEPGLDVTTVGGLHGEVVEVTEDWVDLKVDQDGTVLRFQRQAIGSITSEEAADAEDTADDEA